MNVTISIGGRFHAFDLARQLQKRNWLRTVITSYPKFKVREWNIEARRIRSMVSHELLSRGWRRVLPNLNLNGDPQFVLNTRFDRIAARHIPSDTDILVAWSGMALHSLEHAKSTGAKAILERNSTHIGFQRDILIDEYGRVGRTPSLPDPRFVDREYEEYESADYICVPSSFAYQSFLKRGVSRDKLFLVPFGVDPENFKPVPKRDGVFRLVHCGALNIRKGVQYLLEAWHSLALPNAELWLIGTPTAEIQPYLERFGGPSVILKGTFPQAKLFEEYSQCSAFCLASIEEGFAMTISQAMCCSLPAIVTTNTTGSDIVREGLDGFVVPIRSVEALKDKIAVLHADTERCREMGESARRRILSAFTWDHYGERMAVQYQRIHAGQAPIPYTAPEQANVSRQVV